jgi:hypothetical protein
MITGKKDTDCQILIKLDIKALSRFCCVNKYANTILSNRTYWQQKLEKDNLLYALPYLFNTCSSPSIQYLTAYVKLTKAAEDAKLILTINEIEVLRKDNKTPGIIIMAANDMESYKILTPFLDSEIIKCITSHNCTSHNCIYFTYNNHNEYKFELKEYDYTILELIWQKYQLLKYLTITKFLGYLRYKLAVGDSVGLTFLLTQRKLNNLHNRKPLTYAKFSEILVRRMGIIDTLKYLNS